MMQLTRQQAEAFIDAVRSMRRVQRLSKKSKDLTTERLCTKLEAQVDSLLDDLDKEPEKLF